jgi:hypothetical protein
MVRQVFDQYLEFLSPAPSLFSLIPSTGWKDAPTRAASSSYSVLNGTNEVAIEAELERITKGLFSVVATQGELHELGTSSHGNMYLRQVKYLSFGLQEARQQSRSPGSLTARSEITWRLAAPMQIYDLARPLILPLADCLLREQGLLHCNDQVSCGPLWGFQLL